MGAEGALPMMLEDDGPILEMAAKGDHAAQSLMVDHVIACANAGQVPVGVALGAAEVFARMAAECGEFGQRRKLAGVLLWQAENLWSSGYCQRSQIYQTEAVEMMNRLADDGDEDTAALLSQYADAFNPNILKLAADLSRAGNTASPNAGHPDTTIH